MNFETKAILFTHLAVMEGAGLPTDKAFANLRLPGADQKRLEATIKHLKRGKNIPNAGMAAGLFDQLETHILTAAVSAGSPALTYRRLASLYTEKDRLQKAVKSRLRLPIVVLFMSFVLRQLPAFITGKISIAAYVWSALAPLLLVALGFVISKVVQTHYRQQAGKGKKNPLDHLVLQIPIFGKRHIRRSANQFYEALSLMLEAGMPMFEALPLACKTISNTVIAQEFQQILPRVHQGASLSDALRLCVFVGEKHVIDMASTGEASGTLAEMLWRFSSAETEAESAFQEQVAAWLPRVLYAFVAVWVIYGIFTSNAFMPHVPDDL